MSPALALSILSYKPNAVLGDSSSPAKLSEVKPEIDLQFSRFDIKRLSSYANNLVDYHVILDLLPAVAKYYFLGKFRSVTNDASEQENTGGGGDEQTAMEVTSAPTNAGTSPSCTPYIRQPSQFPYRRDIAFVRTGSHPAKPGSATQKCRQSYRGAHSPIQPNLGPLLQNHQEGRQISQHASGLADRQHFAQGPRGQHQVHPSSSFSR